MKKTVIIVITLLIGIAIGALLVNIVMKSDERHISIGTGSLAGVSYPAGNAICYLFNRNIDDHDTRCSVESTGGSVYNLNMLQSGDLDLGIVQSDQQYDAVTGQGAFAKVGPDDNLRALFSLYIEAFTIVARADANIHSFDDLKGKRVNIGNPGSGQRATIQAIMKEKGWTLNDFKLVSELAPSEQAQALCDNKVDAIIFFAGHPNSSIEEVTTLCNSVLVNIDDVEIQELVANTDHYEKYIIPGGTYPNNDEDIVTLGGKNTVVASANVDDEVVYQLVHAVFDNIDTFRRLHPGFIDIQVEDMINGQADGKSQAAPLHPGARRYYEEIGLLKPESNQQTD
jgi:TRAP transporter TAXI family solute receptor